MVTLAILLLWMGWFGFNPGSVLAFNSSAMTVVLTTFLAAAAALLSVMLFRYLETKKNPDLALREQRHIDGADRDNSRSRLCEPSQRRHPWGNCRTAVPGGGEVVFQAQVVLRPHRPVPWAPARRTLRSHDDCFLHAERIRRRLWETPTCQADSSSGVVWPRSINLDWKPSPQCVVLAAVFALTYATLEVISVGDAWNHHRLQEGRAHTPIRLKMGQCSEGRACA